VKFYATLFLRRTSCLIRISLFVLGPNILFISLFLKEGKSLPVIGRGGSQGCEKSRLPHFLDNRLTDGGEVVSPTRAGRPFPPGKFLVLISVRG
jgi:hypothetical protein